MKVSNCSSKGAPSAGRGRRWYLGAQGQPLLGGEGHGWGFVPTTVKDTWLKRLSQAQLAKAKPPTTHEEEEERKHL